MNEVTLHRGRSPHLNIIDAYVNGQHLTEAVVGPFSAPQAPTHITHEVRRPHLIHTNRFNGVLPVMRRSYRAPLCTRLAPYTNLCSKPEFQTACATRFISYHASGPSLVTFSYASLLLAHIISDQPQKPRSSRSVNGWTRDTHLTSGRIYISRSILLPRTVHQPLGPCAEWFRWC